MNFPMTINLPADMSYRLERNNSTGSSVGGIIKWSYEIHEIKIASTMQIIKYHGQSEVEDLALAIFKMESFQ